MRIIAFLLIFSIVGCSDQNSERLSSVANSINEKAEELKEKIDQQSLIELQHEFESFKEGLESKDLKIIKEKSTVLDSYLGSRVWGWYADIYSEYAKNGKNIALNKIQSFIDTSSPTGYEKEALSSIQKGLEEDLGLDNSGILESVAVQSLRSKFGDNVTDTLITVVLAALSMCRHGC
ncbi:hypothetical protein [Arenicella xantha]|uniref:Lipoprotein n=1 Tax=Arenicella xantha TaxID=644221 RepID=A0A395JHA8_9GAMM|nr:hypothetical protein [Arenicella xantha]RBP49350.1 hypothetical protein DFR28_104281 [Arenicella xantha]